MKTGIDFLDDLGQASPELINAINKTFPPMKTTINLSRLAGTLQAYHNCIASGKEDWEIKHKERIEAMFEALPHGSGIDSGVKFDWARSNGNKLVFSFGFHHMDDQGYYDGWTNHVLTVTPEFQSGYKMRISGPNRRQIKDYLFNLFGSIFYVNPLEPITQ